MPLSSPGGYRKRDNFTGRLFGGSGMKLRLARTSAAHAAGATQAVNLCDTDFVEFSPARTVDAANDSGVAIPAGTKVYIARFAGKWRIVQAFVCTE